MADDGEQSSRAALYGGERKSFGKIRRERKPPTTPYDRPPPHPRHNGWISSLMDPAKRLFSGGASLLPSFFSSPSSVSGILSLLINCELLGFWFDFVCLIRNCDWDFVFIWSGRPGIPKNLTGPEYWWPGLDYMWAEMRYFLAEAR